MKKIFFSFIAFFAFTVVVSAQENRESQQDIQQQLPPRPAQVAIDRAVRQAEVKAETATDKAARQADVNAQNNQNVRAAQDKLKAETERSTGKEMKNPAETNPTTVKPPVLSDPATAPINSGNR